jgi:hypothetical protein
MSADESALATARKSLIRELARRACRDRIAIRFEHDTDALDLRARLYDSTAAGRRINVDYDPDAVAEIDCLEFDALLTVTVKDLNADPRRLWRIVKAWLYDRAEPGAVLSI